MADVTTNIDFFGFTGENTLKDISDWVTANPDDLDLFIATIIENNNKIDMEMSKHYNSDYDCFDDYNTFPLTLLVIFLSKYTPLLYNKYVQSWNKKAIVSDANEKLKEKQLEKLAKRMSNQTDKISDPLEFLKGKADLKKRLKEIIRDFENINMNNGRTLADYSNISYNWLSNKEQGETDLYKKISKFAKNIILLRKANKRLHNIKSEIEKTEKPRKQFVFTGAPGTGKTFGVKAFAKAYIESKGGDAEKQFKFVQFHSSYDYTDFVEGLKPAVIGHNADGEPVTSFVRMDGVFKKFCRKADNDKDKLYFFIIDEINRADLSRVFGELMYCLEESYRGEGNKIDTQYQNLPAYEYKDNSDTATPMANDIFAQGFYIPENVVIIGTMNDIDRSVETFDFALRRRFRWINITAEDSMEILKERLGDIYTDDLKNKIDALNKAIGDDPKLGEAFQLGQSYFTKIDKDDKASLEEYFENELKPILEEYVRGRKKTDAEDFVENCKTAFTTPQPNNSKSGSN